MDFYGLSESSQGELSRQQERALLEKTFQPYNNYKQSVKVKVGKQYFSLRWLSLLMLNFSLIHFYNQEEITFIILFTDPLPCDVASYKADFEGLGVANLKLKNAYALSGVNPSKFTICLFLLVGILTTAPGVQRQFFHDIVSEKAKNPSRMKV